jgi:hypothetical protein
MTSRVRDGSVEGTDRVAEPVSSLPGPTAREGWYTDPTGRHQERWFSGGMPTSLVQDKGVEGRDPLDVDQLSHAAFAAADPRLNLPEGGGGPANGQGPVAWWDGWVAAPGEPRPVPGLDGATGLGIDSTMRAAVRASGNRLPLTNSLLLLAMGVIVLGVGIVCFLAGAEALGLSFGIFGFLWSAVALVIAGFDLVKEIPVRRFQRRVLAQDAASDGKARTRRLIAGLTALALGGAIAVTAIAASGHTKAVPPTPAERQQASSWVDHSQKDLRAAVKDLDALAGPGSTPQQFVPGAEFEALITGNGGDGTAACQRMSAAAATLQQDPPIPLANLDRSYQKFLADTAMAGQECAQAAAYDMPGSSQVYQATVQSAHDYGSGWKQLVSTLTQLKVLTGVSFPPLS